MDITVVELNLSDEYVTIFGGRVPMRTAVVEFSGDDLTGPVRIGFSNRADDPVGMWLADFRVEANGMVVFSHGSGDRTCNKQIAGDLITDAIAEATIVALANR